MKNLTHYQYGKILKAIEIVNFDVKSDTLPDRLINAVNFIVSGDIAAFETISPAGYYQGCLIYKPLDAISPKELEIYNQYVAEHPFYAEILFNRRFDAIKIGDFMSDGKFSNTGIYNEYYRPIGVNRQISVTMQVSEDCLLFGTLSRRGSDFSETERAILNLLSPHFTAAFRHTKLYEQTKNAADKWQSAGEFVGKAVIVLDFEGRVKYPGERITNLLKKYFGGEKFKLNGLPDTLHRWTLKNVESAKNADELHLPPEPFILSADCGKLTIRFSCGNDSVNLLLDEEKKFSAKKLVCLGLTNRETAILFLISLGKSNTEIAVLCDISPRTVQKHTERIYIKLGVENRTAAAMRATEIL